MASRWRVKQRKGQGADDRQYGPNIQLRPLDYMESITYSSLCPGEIEVTSNYWENNVTIAQKNSRAALIFLAIKAIRLFLSADPWLSVSRYLRIWFFLMANDTNCEKCYGISPWAEYFAIIPAGYFIP
jgi:hypothetical protein